MEYSRWTVEIDCGSSLFGVLENPGHVNPSSGVVVLFRSSHLHVCLFLGWLIEKVCAV